MAGKSDIKAGSAYVELLLKNSAFLKGLRASSDKLKSFGTGIATIGGAITAAGASILAPLGAMVNEFLSVGDALDKMRQRTGISVEAIGELAHAAEQSGTDLETVEKAVGKLQKGITSGSKAFAKFGLNVAELKKLSPEKQFERVADTIGRIKDPTRRAAAAMELFGKSGAQLLPMIEDYDALAQEARDLGFVMSGEAAASSVTLGDMLANLWKTVKFGALAIGEALAPTLIELAGTVQRVATVGLKWIQENKSMVVNIAKVGAAVVAVGAVITGLGAAIAGAGVVLGGLATGLTAIGSVIGVILSPLGLIVGALVAGFAAWLKWSEGGQAAVQSIMEAVGPLLDTFKQTFGGISDAIMGGDLALAGSIAMAGLKLALLKGVSGIASAIGGEWGDFVGSLGSTLLEGNFAEAWGMLLDGMVSAAAKAVKAVIDGWQKAMSFASNLILQSPIGGKLLGLDDQQAQAERTRLEQLKSLESQIANSRNRVTGLRESGGGEQFRHGAGSKSELEIEEQQLAELEKRMAAIRANMPDVLADAQGFAADNLSGQAAAMKGIVDAATKAAADRLAQKTSGGAAGAAAGVDSAQAELDRLTAQAEQLREEQRQRDEERKNQGAGIGAAAGGLDGMSSRIAGSFSAAALQAMGGQSPMERAASAAEEQAKKTEEMRKELIATRRAVERAGVFS